MELLKAIKERRSVRSYSEKPVSWELISEILDAARHAPSSGNVQDWRFIVIRNKETIKEIAKISEQDWVEKSQVLIIVCSYLKKIKRMFGEKAELFSIQNTSAAIQNMLLRAYDLELGSCWIGDFNEKELKELLAIDQDAVPYAIISIGYSKEKKKEAERDDLDTVTFFEKYGKRKRGDIGNIPLENSLKTSLEKVRKILNYSKEKIKEK